MRLIDADKLLEGEHFILKCKSEFGVTEMDIFRREAIDNAPTVNPLPNAILEAYLKISDQEFEHSNGFWIMTPKGKKIYFEKKRSQGEWIKGPEISRTMIGDKVEHIEYKDYTCSNCGLVLDRLLYRRDGSLFYKFCPYCGADMRGVENV